MRYDFNLKMRPPMRVTEFNVAHNVREKEMVA